MNPMTMPTPTTQRNTSISGYRFDRLHLETTRPPAATSALELASLAGDLGLLQWLLANNSSISFPGLSVPCGSAGRNRNA